MFIDQYENMFYFKDQSCIRQVLHQVHVYAFVSCFAFICLCYLLYAVYLLTEISQNLTVVVSTTILNLEW